MKWSRFLHRQVLLCFRNFKIVKHVEQHNQRVQEIIIKIEIMIAILPIT